MKKITTLLLLAISTYALAQPTISSLTPASGHPGAAVTIAGTGFNATASDNIVYFGATRATVTSASGTSLTVQVPAGATYMPVSVNNTATSLAAFSENAFLPTYDNSAYPAGATAFEPKVDFLQTTASDPIQVLIQDMDGDGKADLIVMTWVDISVYRNTSTTGAITASSFASPVSYPLPGPYITGGWQIGSQMTIGDVDGDGVPDLLCGRTFTDSFYVMRNISTAGSIGFSALVPFVTGSDASVGMFGINCIALADMDGDGKADVVMGNQDGSISVVLNTSTPGSITTSSFGVPFNTLVTASYGIYGMAVGDLDGDGKRDIVFTGVDSTISVFQNTSTMGSISLASQVTYGSGLAANTQCVVFSDIDGDGKPDLAVTNGINNTLSIFRNTATAGTIDASSFGVPVIFPSAFQAGSIVAGDFDGDGKPDLAVSASTEYWGPGDYNLDQAIYLYHNNAIPGTINQASFFAIAYPLGHNNVFGIAVGDIDGDGKPDIVTANNDDSTISVLRNTPLSPVTITSVSPGSAYPGNAVTINGSNFNTTAADNVVFFGATKAAVTSASSSSLNVTVPIGATYDGITVENTVTKRSASSERPFLPTFDGSGVVPGPILFDTAVNFDDPAGSSGKTVVIADFDGDGKADVAALTSTGFAIYRNTASVGAITSTSFAAAIDSTLPFTAWRGIAAGDINGDGKPDLVVSSAVAGQEGIFIYQNISTSGSVSFASPIFYPVQGFGTAIKIQDINGDGKPDVIMGNQYLTVNVLLNTSDGDIDSSTLTPSCQFYSLLSTGTGTEITALAIDDLDGDGLPDVVVSNGDTIIVYRNVLTGFVPSLVLYAGANIVGVILADVDGDGKMDIASVSGSDNQLSVFHNTATTGVIDSTSFASRVVFATGNGPENVAAGDLNGDGKPELVVLNYLDQSVSIFRNTATSGVINSSSLVVNIDSPAGYIPNFVAIGDIDGDGKADIVTCRSGNPGVTPGGIAVLTNKVVVPITTSINTPMAGNAEMRILPNPNKGIFTVSGVTGTGNDEILTLQVTDLVGQVIYNNKSQKMESLMKRWC